jgi:glycine oxidase
VVTVVVVGAGIVGLSVAYELASRGARVRVLDPRGVAQGATRASAGILAPYTEGHVAPLLELALSSLELYPDFVARVESDSGARVEFERHGSLHVALTDAEAGELRATSQALAAVGAPHELMDADGATRLEPNIASRVTAALLVRPHGYVAASPLAAAVAQAARNRGAAISATAVLGIDALAQGLAVRTQDEVIAADLVVIAAGSWSSRLRGATWVKPIRGQLVELRAQARAASRVVWGTRCYVVPWRDGSVLVGATMEDVGFDETATAGGVRGLIEAATGLMPGLESARFQEVRVGLRPMIADELPAIGRSSSLRGVVYATGHYRNGVLLAPLTARLVADLVMEDRESPQLALVRPDRVGL